MGLITILLAGVRALYESDIKKIVALSTLSQLGLIMVAIGAGLYEIAFFHMLTHAFFKALLFIVVGNIIHLSGDYQDLRKISINDPCAPATLAFGTVANISLCGFPFMAGFYSKDALLELRLTVEINPIIFTILYVAVILTVAYSLRFTFLTM